MADAWVKFYPSDWLAGTGSLTPAERGVYITIVCMIYENDGPVAMDRKRLARRCGAPAGSFARILDALIAEGKLHEGPDGITNKRAEELICVRKNERTRQQSGADKTNAILAEKKQQKQREAERLALRPDNAIPEPEPEPDKEPPLAPPKKSRAVQLPEGWVPSERNYQDAYDRGFSQEEINNEADKFSNHHHAKGSTFKSWDAAWRTWLGNAITYRNRDMARGAQSGGRGQGGSIASIAARRRAARAL